MIRGMDVCHDESGMQRGSLQIVCPAGSCFVRNVPKGKKKSCSIHDVADVMSFKLLRSSANIYVLSSILIVWIELVMKRWLVCVSVPCRPILLVFG